MGVAEDNEAARARAFDHLPPKKNTEWLHQKRIAAWMREVYPKVRFHTSLDGVYLGKMVGQMIKMVQWGPGYPDLIIHKAVKPYSFLAIELKKDGVVIYHNEHSKNQEGWLEYFRQQGAYAEICIGSDQAKQLIKRYLDGKL
jgi:hypothetical protein